MDVRRCDQCKNIYAPGAKDSLRVRTASHDHANRFGVRNPEKVDFCSADCAVAWIQVWAAS